MKKLLLTFFACALLFSFGAPIQAQETSKDIQATITSIDERFDIDGIVQLIFTAEDEKGDEYKIDTRESYLEGVRYDLENGDRVVLQIVPNLEGPPSVYLADVVRTNALIWITILFAAITIAVGLWRGLFAVLGLGVTLGILFGFVFPQILNGADPVITTVLGGLVILAINIPLSHGVSKTTLFAFLSTVAGLFLAVISSNIFVSLSSLSGLANEEANFLFWGTGGAIDPKGLLLAGIIIGAVGVLDDIAVAQGEAVHELRLANPEMKKRDLFKAAMRLGRHHIASTVNTLVLAYVGASMSLIVLSMHSSVGIFEFLNTELVSEEIVRTLAGTSALVLTVPIATALALIDWNEKT